MDIIDDCLIDFSFYSGLLKGNLGCAGFTIDSLVKNSSIEELIYLLLYQKLPDVSQLYDIRNKLLCYRELPLDACSFLESIPKDTHVVDVFFQFSEYMASTDMSLLFDQKPSDEVMLRFIALLPAVLTYWFFFANKKIRINLESNELCYLSYCLFLLYQEKPSLAQVRFYQACSVLAVDYFFYFFSLNLRPCDIDFKSNLSVFNNFFKQNHSFLLNLLDSSFINFYSSSNASSVLSFHDFNSFSFSLSPDIIVDLDVLSSRCLFAKFVAEKISSYHDNMDYFKSFCVFQDYFSISHNSGLDLSFFYTLIYDFLNFNKECYLFKFSFPIFISLFSYFLQKDDVFKKNFSCYKNSFFKSKFFSPIYTR